jgi:hypothetical protein
MEHRKKSLPAGIWIVSYSGLALVLFGGYTSDNEVVLAGLLLGALAALAKDIILTIKGAPK